MSKSNTTSFTTERSEYEARSAAGETVLLAPALHLPSQVREVAEHFRSIATFANGINVLNTIGALRHLRRLRVQYQSREPEARMALRDTVERLAEPVEGSTTLEMGWVQGFTLAAGLSAYTNLESALSAASESLDRKSAYAMACFSLYVAVVSLVATLVLGVLSLK